MKWKILSHLNRLILGGSFSILILASTAMPIICSAGGGMVGAVNKQFNYPSTMYDAEATSNSAHAATKNAKLKTKELKEHKNDEEGHCERYVAQRTHAYDVKAKTLSSKISNLFKSKAEEAAMRNAAIERFHADHPEAFKKATAALAHAAAKAHSDASLMHWSAAGDHHHAHSTAKEEQPEYEVKGNKKVSDILKEAIRTHDQQVKAHRAASQKHEKSVKALGYD